MAIYSGFTCRNTTWNTSFAVCSDGSGMLCVTWHHNFVRKRLCCFFLLVSGTNRMEREQNIFRCIAYIYIYIYPYPHNSTVTTGYPHDVTIDVSIISPLYPNSIAMISPLFTLYPPLKTCPWYSHHIPMISLWYPKYIPMNVGKTIINHPMFDSLYHPLMVNLGMF